MFIIFLSILLLISFIGKVKTSRRDILLPNQVFILKMRKSKLEVANLMKCKSLNRYKISTFTDFYFY